MYEHNDDDFVPDDFEEPTEDEKWALFEEEEEHIKTSDILILFKTDQGIQIIGLEEHEVNDIGFEWE